MDIVDRISALVDAQLAAGERGADHIAELIAVEVAGYAGEADERWWRAHLPIDTEIAQEIIVYDRGRTRILVLTIGGVSYQVLDRYIRIQLCQSEESRIVVDILTAVAPHVGDTWTPLTEPGVVEHPDGLSQWGTR